jgi:hypothetical protein
MINDIKKIQLAESVKKNIQKGFGKTVCKELHLDCASCKAQVLIGHLNWYIDLLEFSIDQDKQMLRQHKIRKASKRKK